MTLSPPEPALRACVVVPARNEEDLIASCLLALATQRGVEPEAYEVLLVLDDCTDQTEALARETALECPGLRLHFLEGPAEGSGAARRVGMDGARDRLMRVGRPDGLIACTDADTVVAKDWISAQLRAVSEGARAIGGRIELADDGSLPEGVRAEHAERGRLRYERLLSEPDRPGKSEHWQFSGASLALTAEVYAEVGGLEPKTDLEDEHLEGVLRHHGVPIDRLLSVRATTSPRLKGRAKQGLAHDLAAAAARLDRARAG
ncbi:MAG: glycosyltransferase family 2 protein [Rubrobacteraceae bacterium]|nr:glycosyltransferase family 2 protein [Rubrobacteraceae bacterium]